MSRRVAVIGSGLGGLAAACTLAARGHEVTVYEKQSWIGGKAAVLESDGFRFDMGPTILTVPSVLRRIFSEAGEALEDHLDLVRLDPQWRSFFDDGATLDLFEGEDRMVDELERFAPGSGSGRGYQELLKLSRELHDVSDRYFFYKAVDSVPELLKQGFDGLGSIPRLMAAVGSIRPWATVGGTIRGAVPDPRAAQMLDHFTQYVGSAPDSSPAVLCGIASMQVGEGVWYPIGGTRAVPVALAKLAESLGVTFVTGNGVQRILHDGRRVSAVVTDDGEQHDVDAVVSNMDSVRTHKELIGGAVADRFGRRYGNDIEPACSGVVLYLGLKERYEHLAHHNFVFSRDPHEEFDAIYRKGIPAPDPTVYLAAPSVSEEAVAPEGGEALYALVHTPYLRPGQNWDQMFPGYRQVILDKLARAAGLEDLESRVVFEGKLTPQDIHDRYSVLNGAIYGLASHGRWSGAFKPNNRSRELEGLYLAGGAAHPGPGMPMVMMSGWIAGDVCDADAPSGARAA